VETHIGRDRRTRRAIGTATLLLLLTLVGASASSARAAPPTPSDCGAAAALVKQGLPQRALELAVGCVKEAALARTETQTAVSLATKAEEELLAGKVDSAGDYATAALAHDKENAEAAAVLTDVAAAEPTIARLQHEWNAFVDEQLSPLGGLLLVVLTVPLLLLVVARLTALAVREWPDADDLPNDRLRGAVLRAGIALMLAAAVLASLAVADAATPPTSRLMTWTVFGTTMIGSVAAVLAARRADQRKLDGSSALLLLATLTGGLALVGLAVRLLWGDNQPPAVELASVIGLAALAATLSVWLTSWWLATRIRLNVTGPKDAAEIGTVVALLSELGAEAPKGLEVPRGADVTALDGAFSTLPDNPVLKVLKDLVRSLSGVTPWTATIEGDSSARVVTVVRNGRSAGSAIIDPMVLGLVAESPPTPAAASSEAASGDSDATPDGTPDDPTLRMAAAFVLVTMASSHRSIRRGLAGTSSWKSLGYHYIGTTLPQTGRDVSRSGELLGRALSDDPGNLAAALAFRHTQQRGTDDLSTLRDYESFLVHYRRRLVGLEGELDIDALALRAEYTRALTLVNAAYAQHNLEVTVLPSQDDYRVTAKTALKEFSVTVEPDPADTDGISAFKAQYRDDIKGSLRLMGLPRSTADAEGPTGIYGIYNEACTFASRNDLMWSGAPGLGYDVDDLQAVRLLQHVAFAGKLKDWAEHDPQLTAFKLRPAYRTAFLSPPRTNWFELTTVEPLADRLKAMGYGTPRVVARATVGKLCVDTYAPLAACAAVRELACLHEGLTQRSVALSTWSIEILDALDRRGMARLALLASLTKTERAALATDVANTVVRACRPAADTDATAETGRATHVRAWLRRPY